MPVKGKARSRWLCQALHSILLQDYDDLELLVQDGGVDDPVVGDTMVGRLFALFEGRVKYVLAEDRGIMAASNTAIRRSTGDILYWMGDDEFLCPSALVSVNEVFEAERFGGPLWLYGQTVSADIHGKTLGIDGAPTTREEMLMHNRIGTPSVFWNRQIMDMVGLFDPRWRWSGDYDMWLRFWSVCEPVFLNQTLGVFRHHDQQASQVQRSVIDRDTQVIAWRHESLGNEIFRARSRSLAQLFHPSGIPETLN